MPENLSLPHLMAGRFQLQQYLDLNVVLLARTNLGCFRPALPFQSCWLHKTPGQQASPLSWHWNQNFHSAPALGFPQYWSRKLVRLESSAQRLRPLYWLILLQLVVTYNSKLQPSKLLWEPRFLWPYRMPFLFGCLDRFSGWGW